MPRRLTGGFFFFFFFFFDTRDEKIAATLTALTCLALALTTLPVRRTVANGETLAEIVAFGWVIPKWAFILIGSVVATFFYFLYKRLINWIWPEQDAVCETVRVEEVVPRGSGGFVAWQPEVPGTSSPLEYTPPSFTVDTTAEEFLATRPPSPMRVLLGGNFYVEAEEFDELRYRWLQTAPEATLRGLLLVGEQLLLRNAKDNDVIHALIDARDNRGIPTTEELIELADKISNAEFRSWVGD